MSLWQNIVQFVEQETIIDEQKLLTIVWIQIVLLTLFFYASQPSTSCLYLTTDPLVEGIRGENKDAGIRVGILHFLVFFVGSLL